MTAVAESRPGDRFVRHVGRLWGRWFWIPSVPLSYALLMLAVGDLRGEHLLIAGLAIAIGYAGPRAKRFFVDVAPALLVGFGYDLVRYARAALVTPERVLGCELRDVELRLVAAGPHETWPDFFARHHAAPFDVLFAIPYAIFLYLALAYAVFLFFSDRARMRWFLWAFAIANFASFALWLLIPAAPPWYLRAHGCAIDLAALPSPAALARVDALVGTEYFARFYSRAASVFGAMPSMHCAYPVLGLLTAWRSASWRTRPLHIAYALLMAVAAVYLDHHWVVDVVAGWALAAAAVCLASRVVRDPDDQRRSARRAAQ